MIKCLLTEFRSDLTGQYLALGLGARTSLRSRAKHIASVFLVFHRAFHRSEYHRASNTIDKLLRKRHQCPLLPQFYVSVILNGFDKTFLPGFLLKETDVMFSPGTFATTTVITF